MLKRVALSTLFAAVLAPSAQAQDFSDLEEQFALFAAEDVVISASRHEQKASEAPSAIYVITAREIEASSALTLGDLLRRVPGMDVYRVNQGYTIIGARGLATEQNNLVLVLLDGREINVELFGIPFIEQIPVTLDEIERIEVIRGPGSALYGANAFSGVVSIITRLPKENGSKHQAFVGAGNFGQVVGEVRTVGREDKFAYQTSARYRRADRFSDPEQLDIQSSSARTVLTYDVADDSALTADIGLDNSRGQIFTTIGAMPAELFQTGTRLGYSRGKWETQAFWNVLDARLQIRDATLNPPGTPLDERILTNLNGVANTYDLQSQYTFGTGEINRLIVGGNTRWNNFSSDVLANESSNEIRLGLFLQDEYRPVNSLLLTAGARLDYYLFESSFCEGLPPAGVSCAGDYQTMSPEISPRLTAVWTPIDNQTFRLSAGRAFRKPAFFERQMQVAALERLNLNFANPALPNETVLAGELGYVTRFGDRVRFNADFFYNRYDNFIVFEPNQVRFDVQREDGEPVQVNAYGGELTTKFLFTAELEGMASYAYMTKDPDDRADPTHKVNAELTYRPAFGLVANVFASYISAREWRITNPERGNLIVPFTSGQDLGNYTVLDARLGYKVFERLEIGVIGKNLLGEHREFPGISDVNVDQDPFTPRENYGGEPILRTGLVYLEGRF
jgi:iron complex outermembrane recepter protein